MKNLLLIFSVLLSTSLSAVEYGYFMVSGNSISEDIVLNEGDTFEIIECYPFPSNDRNGMNLIIDFQSNGAEDLLLNFYYKIPELVAGPCSIRYRGRSNNSKNYISYKIIRASEYQNSNVFSVIGDSSSTHNVVVETSTDLENWTPVHSSGLTGSSEQIYVRTRISTSE
ncbi:MAG: hypothetical protein ACJZ9B_05655 [Coraliomargaritaceae bacterium]